MSRSSRTRSVWEAEGFEHNAEAPAIVKAARGERWKRWTIGGLAFVAVPLAALGVMGNVASSVSRTDGTVDVSTISITTNDSIGKSVAWTTLADWIAGTPSPFPGGVILSWDGFTTQAPPAQTSKNEDPIEYSFETHRFTVVRDGERFNATVQVAVTEAGAAVATSTPSLSPIADIDLTQTPVDWFGVKSSSTASTPEVQESISSWLTAFASGDPDELRRAIQDSKKGRSFVPLTGVKAVTSSKVTAVAELTDENDKPTGYVVARVSAVLNWGDVAVDGKQSTQAPVTWDVLVADADSATPYVVAWGAPGTGPDLTPYENGVTGVDVEQRSATPAASPSATAKENADG